MAVIKNGPIGRFRGKVDTIVVSRWKNLTVGRSVPSKSSKPATMIQLQQRAKFGLVNSFLSKMGSIITTGYQNSGGNVTAYNVASKYHLNIAVTGVYPAYKLDYSKVQLCDGIGTLIEGFSSVTTTTVEGSRATVTWQAIDATRPESLPTDKLFAVVYNETQNYFFNQVNVAERSKLTASVRLPFEEDKDVVHVWVMFISADGKMVSKSRYLGQFVNV